MPSKKELELQVKSLRAELAESMVDIVTPIRQGVRVTHSDDVEIMYSVKKASLTEIKVEKCTVIDGKIVQREFLAEDIGAIAKSKMWKSIYELTQGSNKRDEKSNVNQQEPNTGENNGSDSAGEQTDNGKGSEAAGNPSGHDELGGGLAATDNKSESPEDGNVASGGSSEHGSSSSSNGVDGERDRTAII